MKVIAKLGIMLTVISTAFLCSHHSTVNADYKQSIRNVSGQEYKTNIPYSSVRYSAPNYSSVINAVGDSQDKTYPEAFDLRDHGIITPVRDQKEISVCWAICASESIESQILKNKYEPEVDISEWHLAYFTYADSALIQITDDSIFNNGGNHNVAASTLSKWIGPVYESKAAFGSAETLDKSLKYEHDYTVQDIYNVHSWISSGTNYPVSFIKELVYDENPVSIFYDSSALYYNPITASQCCISSENSISHAVMIVGWDDNYPRENFLSQNRPQKNGAWLIKNSWGEDWGQKGYFWLSYEDKSICEAACYFCEPNDTYANNYYYDDYGWTTSIAAESSQKNLTGYMANVFHAKSSEMLNAVSFYTAESYAEYEINVYTDLDGTGSPVKGTTGSSISGIQKYSGYHTVKLDKPVKIAKDSDFSIVVKITNHLSPYTIPIDASMTVAIDNTYYRNVDPFSLIESAGSYQSFISADGTSWTDVAGKSYRYKYPEYLNISGTKSKINQVLIGNVCLNAFTVPAGISGDVNNDGIVDITDLLLITQHILNSSCLTDEQLLSADMNSDNIINLLDIINIKNVILSAGR